MGTSLSTIADQYLPRAFRAEMPSIRGVLTTPGAELSPEALLSKFAASGLAFPGQVATGFRERQAALGFDLMEAAAAAGGAGERELVLLQRQYNSRPVLLANLRGAVLSANAAVSVAAGGLPPGCSAGASAAVSARQLELRDPDPLWFPGTDHVLFRALLLARLNDGGKWALKSHVREQLRQAQAPLAQADPALGAQLASALRSFDSLGPSLSDVVASSTDDPVAAGKQLLDYFWEGAQTVASVVTDRLQGKAHGWVNPGTEQLIRALALVVNSGRLPWLVPTFADYTYRLRCLAVTPLWAGARLSQADLVALLERLGYAPHPPGNTTLAPGTYWTDGALVAIDTCAALHGEAPTPVRVNLTTGDAGLSIDLWFGNTHHAARGIWLFPPSSGVSVVHPTQPITIDTHLTMTGAVAGAQAALTAQASTSLGAVSGGATGGLAATGTAYTLQTSEWPYANVTPRAITQETAITYLQASAAASAGRVTGSQTVTNSLRYRSAVAFWRPPGWNEDLHRPVETGYSGLSYGLSVPVASMAGLIRQTDAATLAECADALKVTPDWLAWALGAVLNDYLGHAPNGGTWLDQLGVSTLLLESAWSMPADTTVTLATTEAPHRVQPFLQPWLAVENRSWFEGLYVRYRVSDALGAAGGRFQLGAVVATPGITLQDVGTAGYESTVELGWLRWTPSGITAGGSEPPRIPPVALLCQ